MRTFLNSILSFIDSESLTDEEFASLPDTLVQGYNEYVYQALRSILQAREGVSSQLKKLQAYFTAKGVSVASTTVAAPMSQILVGAALQ